MNAYDHVLHDGKTVDRITDAALKEAERRLGYPLTILQGSYHAGVDESAGTHDGGGAVDLAPWDWRNKVRVMRAIGFAAWHRPAIPGVWGEHIHCILIGNQRLSRSAAEQVVQYRNGQNGLANHGPDDFPRPSPIPVFRWVPDWKTRGYNIDWALHHLATVKGSPTTRRVKQAAIAAKHLRALPATTTNDPHRRDTTGHRIHNPTRGEAIDAALDHIAAALRNTKGPVRRGHLYLARRALRKVGTIR